VKAVVTIFQCKRVVLPHLFLRHGLPRMRDVFPGEMRAHLIQHVAGVAPEGSTMGSARLPDDRLERVRRWTAEGRFEGATIERHTTRFDPHPALPSYRLGVELALREGADLHVWLEDDALIFDPECDTWPERLRDRDVGVFRRAEHVHVAYLVSRPEFDRRLRDLMRREELWSIDRTHPVPWPARIVRALRRRLGREVPPYRPKRWRPGPGHVEHYTTLACEGGRAHLPEDAAARIHPGTDSAALVRLVRRMAPGEESLLEVDFTPEELGS
jgi:hypothetical protein